MTDKQCRKRVQNFQNFRRADLVVRHQQLEMLECLVKKVNEEKKMASRVKFSYRRCFLESLVLGKSKYDLLKMSFIFNPACFRLFRSSKYYCCLQDKDFKLWRHLIKMILLKAFLQIPKFIHFFKCCIFSGDDIHCTCCGTCLRCDILKGWTSHQYVVIKNCAFHIACKGSK